MAKKEVDNSFGVASVILGILSIAMAPGAVLAFVYGPFVGIVLGIIGIVFAQKQKRIKNNKWVKAGRTLSIIGLVLGALFAIWIIKVFIEMLNSIRELQQTGALEQFSNV